MAVVELEYDEKPKQIKTHYGKDGEWEHEDKFEPTIINTEVVVTNVDEVVNLGAQKQSENSDVLKLILSKIEAMESSIVDLQKATTKPNKKQKESNSIPLNLI